MNLDTEIAREVLRPHFDAVRDVYSEFMPHGDSGRLSKVTDIWFEIDPDWHDSERHFAGCLEDGSKMIFAPQIVDLPIDTLVAILAHEFGHAVDFLYPAHWRMQPGGPGKAEWIGDPQSTKWGRQWSKQWHKRTDDEVEWAADGIAQAVIGRPIGYCGPCLLQCFSGGVPRPEGLR
jgi:hypothetical protein